MGEIADAIRTGVAPNSRALRRPVVEDHCAAMTCRAEGDCLMTNQWSFKIEVYPHSTGHGQAVDTEACGGRYFERTVTADNVREALIFASLFAEGVAQNPRVWQANVVELRNV